MRRAFLVLGPESSGCRLVTRLLMAAGCDGDPQHLQRWDTTDPPADSEMIVWRRSVPHHHEWPLIADMAARMKALGYDCHAVVTVRDLEAMVASQVETFAHVPDAEVARDNIHRAMAWIFGGIARAGIPFTVSLYENLLLPGGVEHLWQRLGLHGDVSRVEPIYDANARRGRP